MNILIRYIFALFYKYFNFFKERRFVKTKDFSSKEIRFSGELIKSCVGFIDLVDSGKNTITMDKFAHMREYYSTLINSVYSIVKSSNGKVIKNLGDCILFYFPKTSDSNNLEPFKEAIECGFKL